MTTKKVTPTEYADARNIGLSAVTKMLRADKLPIGVISVEKHSRFYLLTVKVDKNGAILGATEGRAKSLKKKDTTATKKAFLKFNKK